jgi:hypothetical protein
MSYSFRKYAVLIFTLLLAFFYLWPTTNYLVFLSAGDHGRDLYCFKQTLEGQTPYRDYMWIYGPLMPYYYSLFLKFFGISISSVLIGKLVLLLTGAAFFYLTLVIFASPFL